MVWIWALSFPSNPPSVIYPWNSEDILTRSHLLAVTEVNPKANPGQWVQRKDIHLIHLANAAKQLLLEQWRNQWTLHLVSASLLWSWQTLQAEAAKYHLHGEGESRKHCDFLASDDYRPILFMSFTFQTQRSVLLPWADVLDLSSFCSILPFSKVK